MVGHLLSNRCENIFGQSPSYLIGCAMKPQALIIEDDKNMANAFAEAVALAGYGVQVANDGLVALSMVRSQSFHFVLLDLHLPGMTGEHILEKIREMPHMAGANVVLATADDRKAEELQGTADLVFLKPVGFTQLRDIAKRMFALIDNEGDGAESL